MTSIDFDQTMTIAFQTVDRAKAAAWYERVLGCALLYDVAQIGWCELSCPVPGVQFGLSEVESPKVGAGPVPTLGVKDLDAARASMEAQDVRFDGPTMVIEGMVKLATFYDPDGNALMLNESLAQQ